jgi:hypothetical protein
VDFKSSPNIGTRGFPCLASGPQNTFFLKYFAHAHILLFHLLLVGEPEVNADATVESDPFRRKSSSVLPAFIMCLGGATRGCRKLSAVRF